MNSHVSLAFDIPSSVLGKTAQLFYYFGSSLSVLQMVKDFATYEKN